MSKVGHALTVWLRQWIMCSGPRNKAAHTPPHYRSSPHSNQWTSFPLPDRMSIPCWTVGMNKNNVYVKSQWLQHYSGHMNKAGHVADCHWAIKTQTDPSIQLDREVEWSKWSLDDNMKWEGVKWNVEPCDITYYMCIQGYTIHLKC